MPKQLITIEVEYNLLEPEQEGDPSLNEPPSNWPWMEMCDGYDEGWEGDGPRTYTRSVRLVQASAVTYNDQDRAEAAEAETTLLELGIHE